MIIIKQEHLNRIKRALGGENLLLEDDEIKDICIAPALERYYSKFPIKEKEIVASVSSQTNIPFPSEDIFGVMAINISPLDNRVGGQTGFWQLWAYQNSTGNLTRSRTGAYNVAGYNPNSLTQQNVLERQKIKTNMNYFGTISYNIDRENKELNVYNTIEGQLNIVWAKKSDNFSDIKYERINDVINLCKANLIFDFVEHSSVYSDSGLDTEINTDGLLSKAEKLQDDVLEKWAEIPDVIVLNAN